jgi:hypothetical protein
METRTLETKTPRQIIAERLDSDDLAREAVAALTLAGMDVVRRSLLADLQKETARVMDEKNRLSRELQIARDQIAQLTGQRDAPASGNAGLLAVLAAEELL